MTDTAVEPAATMDEARKVKREVEKRISEMLRDYQRQYGVLVKSVDTEAMLSTSAGLYVSTVRLIVQL